MRLENKSALVTGAAQGIGEGIAIRFAQEGADVAIADINLDAAQKVAEKIRSIGRRSVAIECDVANSSDVKRTVKDSLEQLGRIDILVNNAGIRPLLSLLEMPEETWNRALAVNLTAHFLFIKEVAPWMAKQGKGKIINMASIAAVKPTPNRIGYTVPKAALVMLTRQAALELAPKILVNAIAPGIVHTPMTGRYLTEDTPDSKAMKATLERLPIPRMGTVEEIASMAVFLASNESDFATGSVFTVDGGITLQ